MTNDDEEDEVDDDDNADGVSGGKLNFFSMDILLMFPYHIKTYQGHCWPRL